MKKVVSFSGGRTSAYLCKLMIDKFGVENVDFIFMDTGGEHPETYEFIRKVNNEFGLNLVCLRGNFHRPLGSGVGYKVVSIDEIKTDLKPFSEMTAKYGVPYIGGMFCTDRMKLKTFKKYCDEKYGKGNYETWLGIRFDEPKRLVGDNKKLSLSAYKQLKLCGLSDGEISLVYTDAIVGRIDQWEISDLAKELLIKKVAELKKSNIKNMAEISDHEKPDVLNYWEKMPFDLGIPEQLGNCVFCPKKSDLKLAAAQRDEPELYINWLDMLYSDSVRVDNKTGHWSKMYRGKQSLERLIAKFDGSTGKEIKARIRGAKMEDTGSCSESCEVFNDGN